VDEKMAPKFYILFRNEWLNTDTLMLRLVWIFLLLGPAGCCGGGGRHYTDGDALGFQPAYCEWRFVCRQASRFDPSQLPALPSVACAYGNLCDEKEPTLERLRRHAELYSRTSVVRESDVERGVPGEDLATGLVEKGQPAHEFEYLCEDAVAEGFDIVIISYHNDFTVMQGGVSREVSASCSGAIIAVKSRQVIAPILVQYGTSNRSITGNDSAPDVNAPTIEQMQARFADEVAAKLEAKLSARSPAATNPSSVQTPTTMPGAK